MADWVASLDIDGWSLGLALLTALATWLLAVFARKGTRKLLAKVPALTPALQTLIVRVVNYAIILLGVGIALSFFGASIQPLIAVAIIVGVVLVLVLRGIADNFAAGVVLQTRRPISIGDEIESDGTVGIVQELNGRSVVVRTVDGQTVHLPNSSVLQNPLVNNSAHGARRSTVEVRVATGGPSVDEVGTVVVDAATAATGVHRHEPLILRTIARTPERTVLHVQFWHHPLHGVAVRSAVVDAVADALASHSFDAVVTSDVPTAPLTPADRI
ncbi:small-conductance mechanosensitive channel [Agromyces hippuratus]|uniref:Small-conductance mechanosensitive channel n=1 Tax=Agromyces hippuratus TaxID=286438 RepID=A0A852WUB2_9MICO|nr:mechanosensitive ion channel domain-containing protein [Agromyces hippuratus]NYG21596.1 small-conductance mechanosensitive channel [Agromyces hippuratus]